MSDNEDVLRALQLHDDGLKADDNIAIGLAAGVTVVVLVVIAGLEILRVTVLDFAIGETITNSRIKLVEGFPFELLKLKESRGLNGTPEGGGPNSQLASFFCRLPYKVRQNTCIGLTAL